MLIQLSVLLLNVFLSLVALQKSKKKTTILARPYKICEIFGSFVWADHVIFGPFWILIALITFLLNDLLLFGLFFVVFWLVRSSGEVVYWFFQQFHPRAGNEPTQFWINKHVPGEAVWFMHQIFWQCIAIVSFVLTIFFTYLWLASLSH